MSKNKKGPINVYEKTLKRVREYVKDIPGMTITRFYDEAALEKLDKKVNKEKPNDI